MPIFMDSPSGERPPKRKRSIGLWMAIAGAGKDVIAKSFILLLLRVPVYLAMMWWWWRGRETAQDVIPEASAQAQVKAARAKAAHGRDEAMA